MQTTSIEISNKEAILLNKNATEDLIYSFHNYPLLNRIILPPNADILLMKNMMSRNITLNHYPVLKILEFRNAKIKFDDRQGLD